MSDQSARIGERLSIAEKLGYALGDTASNLVFQILAIFAMSYYTDTVGLEPAVVGVLLLLVRGVDAITDPIMGGIADRTNTKMGRYRPWLIWLAVPFGVAGVLTFSVPESTPAVETGYVFVTYILITLVYTAINIPYSALISSMTSDPVERQQIQSWRFVGGQMGALTIGMFTLPLVEQLGGGAAGWRNTLIVYGIAAVVMFLICFASTRERIGGIDPADQSAENSSVLRDLGRLWQNDQWRVLCAINFVLLTALIIRVQTVNYFIKDSMAVPAEDVGTMVSAYFTLGGVAAISASFVPNVISERFSWGKLMLPVLFQLGLSAAVVLIGMVPLQLALFGIAATMIAIGACTIIGRMIGRVQMLMLMFAAQVVGQMILFAIGSSSFAMSALAFAMISFFNQVAVPILWTLMADSVDYGEAKTGHRLPAMTFSTVLFALKAGIAAAGFIGGLLLAWYGYQPAAEVGEAIVQSDRTLNGIVITFALVPAIISVALVWLASKLTLTRAAMYDVHERLAVNANS